MAVAKGQTISEGFWKSVIIETPDNPDACWAWDGSTDRDGYGKFNSTGKVIAAHRASFMLNVGEIPEGQHVRHSCDNPPCTNPRHLISGTRSDNMQDAVARGRFRNRTQCAMRLTDEKREEIRALALPKRAIARIYGVSISTVRSIQRVAIGSALVEVEQPA